jgi:hypothetical protein
MDERLKPPIFFSIAVVTVLALIAAVPVFLLWSWGVFDFSPDVAPLHFESAAWKRAEPIEHHRTVRS